MPRLTTKRVESLKRPGRYGDVVPTLCLIVTPTGSKNWVQRIMRDGKRHDIGLGGYPCVGLSEARDEALRNRQMVRRGEDPLAGKRQHRIPTFKAAAARLADANRAKLTKTSAATRVAMLDRYCSALLNRRVDRIGQADVLHVLAPIWTSKPPTARKLRAAIRATLAWCQAHGYIEHNPAGEAIDGALPAQPAVRAHHRAIPYPEVAAALRRIEASTASLPVRTCLRFVALTGVRSGEARLAKWDEIDMGTREWRIPAERMKMGAEHRVPLSDAAVAVLESVQGLRSPSSYIFPAAAKPSKPVSYNLTRVLESVGLDATVHGFRSAFRTWAAERTSVPHAVAEMALAHRIAGDVEKSYNRSDLFEKRRALMDQWAEYVTI